MDRAGECRRWRQRYRARRGRGRRALANKILELRPANKVALYGQAAILSNLAGVATDDMRPLEALETARGALAAQRKLVAFDPGNTVARNNVSAALSALSDAQWSLGRVQDSIKTWEEAVENMRLAAKGAAGFKFAKVQYLWQLAKRRTEAGEYATIPKISQEMVETTRIIRANVPKESQLPLWSQSATVSMASMVALMRNDPQETLRLVREMLPAIESAKVTGVGEGSRDIALYYYNFNKSRAEFMLGDYAAAEGSARAALEARKRMQFGANFDAAEQDMESTQIALTLVAQNRGTEAAKILEPLVKRRRDMQARNHGDMDTRAWLAAALYAQATMDPAHRGGLLREGAALIDGTTAEYRNLYTTRLWRDQITQAQRGVFPGRGEANIEFRVCTAVPLQRAAGIHD